MTALLESAVIVYDTPLAVCLLYSVSQKSSLPKTFCDIFTYGEPV